MPTLLTKLNRPTPSRGEAIEGTDRFELRGRGRMEEGDMRSVPHVSAATANLGLFQRRRLELVDHGLGNQTYAAFRATKACRVEFRILAHNQALR
jgi:hypothetical protein